MDLNVLKRGVLKFTILFIYCNLSKAFYLRCVGGCRQYLYIYWLFLFFVKSQLLYLKAANWFIVTYFIFLKAYVLNISVFWAGASTKVFFSLNCGDLIYFFLNINLYALFSRIRFPLLDFVILYIVFKRLMCSVPDLLLILAAIAMAFPS